MSLLLLFLAQGVATNTWYNYTTQAGQPMPIGQYSITSYTKPSGGVWTPTDIDSMQIGMESVWATSGSIYVSTVFAVIEYVPGGGGGGSTRVPLRSLLGVGT